MRKPSSNSALVATCPTGIVPDHTKFEGIAAVEWSKAAVIVSSRRSIGEFIARQNRRALWWVSINLKWKAARKASLLASRPLEG